MKKNAILFIFAVLASLLAGCGEKYDPKEIADYFSAASPDSSAMMLFVYDGTHTTGYILSDSNAERKVIKDISKKKASPVMDWAPGNNDLPLCALEIYGADEELSILSTGEMAILGDGRGYKFDLNLFEILDKYAFSEMETWDGIMLPNSYYAALATNGWNKFFMNVSEAKVDPSVRLSLSEISGTVANYNLTLAIVNDLESSWLHGDEWALEVKLDGIWYRTPSKEPIYFNQLAYGLMPGETGLLVACTSPYGYLPDGEYRIVIPGFDSERYKIDAAIEFIVKNGEIIFTAFS